MQSNSGITPNNSTWYNVNYHRLRANTIKSTTSSSLSTGLNISAIPQNKSNSNDNKVATELNIVLNMEAMSIGLVSTDNEVGDHLRSYYCDQHVGK